MCPPLARRPPHRRPGRDASQRSWLPGRARSRPGRVPRPLGSLGATCLRHGLVPARFRIAEAHVAQQPGEATDRSDDGERRSHLADRIGPPRRRRRAGGPGGEVSASDQGRRAPPARRSPPRSAGSARASRPGSLASPRSRPSAAAAKQPRRRQGDAAHGVARPVPSCRHHSRGDRAGPQDADQRDQRAPPVVVHQHQGEHEARSRSSSGRWGRCRSPCSRGSTSSVPYDGRGRTALSSSADTTAAR